MNELKELLQEMEVREKELVGKFEGYNSQHPNYGWNDVN